MAFSQLKLITVLLVLLCISLYIPVASSEESFDLNLGVYPEGCGEVFGAGSYNAGEIIFIETMPSSGCEFLYWMGDDGSSFSHTQAFEFEMPATPFTLNAVYALPAPYNLNLIRYDDESALFTWDFETTSESFLGFEVYIDGSLQGVFEIQEYFIPFLEGVHTLSVRAVYTAGYSRLVEQEFAPEEEYSLTIHADLTQAIHSGLLDGFNSDSNYIGLTGNFLDWQEPNSDLSMTKISDSPLVYEANFNLASGNYQYKFFSDLLGDGWDSMEWSGDPNREIFLFSDMIVQDTFGFRNVLYITNCEELQSMNEDLTATYILRNDVDCSESRTWNDGLGFLPIASLESRFSGSLIGNNYTIHNLFINRSSNQYVGLFSALGDSSSVSNVTFSNATIYGNNSVGVLAASAINANIHDVVVKESSVNMFGWVAGGLVAELQNSVVSNSHVENISMFCSGVQCGGFVSKQYGSQISNSSVSGFLDCNHFDCGGFASLLNIGGVINNSYADVIIEAENVWTGGFIGRIIGEAYVYNSYSTGSIISSSSSVGGFIGFIQTLLPVKITTSYSTTNISGVDSVGGFIGTSFSGNISKCFTNNTINNVGIKTGGFVGDMTGGIISDSYSVSFVSGTNFLGGFVGEYVGSALIKNSYFAGELSGESINGFAGAIELEYTGSTTNVYDSDLTNCSDEIGAFPKSTQEMKLEEMFLDLGWSIGSNETDIWHIINSVSYPCLAWHPNCFYESLPSVIDEIPVKKNNFLASIIVGCPFKSSTIVVYNDEGEPVSRANLKITGSNETYIGQTSQEGLYSISLPKGNYSVDISGVNYNALRASFEVVICAGNQSESEESIDQLLQDIVLRFSQQSSSTEPFIPTASAGPLPVFRSVDDVNDSEELFSEKLDNKTKQSSVLSFENASTFSLFILVLIILLVILGMYVRHKVKSHKKQL